MKICKKIIKATLSSSWLRFKNVARIVLSPIWLLENKINAVTRDILAKRVKDNSYWLDVGCGLKPFSSSFNHAHYTGIDVKISGRLS